MCEEMTTHYEILSGYLFKQIKECLWLKATGNEVILCIGLKQHLFEGLKWLKGLTTIVFQKLEKKL